MDENLEKVCVEADCQNTFTLSQSEQDYYIQKGFTLPKRCNMCRLKRNKTSRISQMPLE